MEVTKCLSTDEWIKKEVSIYIYTMEYYSAMRKKEILPSATTWMDLKGIMLSERSQRKIVFTVCFCLYVECKTKQTYKYNKTETESPIQIN